MGLKPYASKSIVDILKTEEMEAEETWGMEEGRGRTTKRRLRRMKAGWGLS